MVQLNATATAPVHLDHFRFRPICMSTQFSGKWLSSAHHHLDTRRRRRRCRRLRPTTIWEAVEIDWNLQQADTNFFRTRNTSTLVPFCGFHFASAASDPWPVHQNSSSHKYLHCFYPCLGEYVQVFNMFGRQIWKRIKYMDVYINYRLKTKQHNYCIWTYLK